MSLLIDSAPSSASRQDTPLTRSAPAVTAHYTICPVLVASNVAVELGWLDEEFARAGVALRYLRSLPEEIGWLPHFSHRLDNLFRDGGNIPSIWARADNTDTKLVGLTFGPSGGQLLVRVSSGLRRAADLKGGRVGLYRSLNAGKIDWWRATGDRGIELALALGGLERSDVEWVDIPYADDIPAQRASRPSELWARRFRDPAFIDTPEVRALRAGQVDAIYSNPARSQALVASGEFTVIEDLDRHPDWTLQLANSPYAITVNAEFAEAHPEAVVAFLRAAVRAGRWINANPAAAAAILHRTTYYPSVEAVARAIAPLDLIPQLSPRNLAGIEQVKTFLLKRGYLQRDFDVGGWADDRFLNEAVASL